MNTNALFKLIAFGSLVGVLSLLLWVSVLGN